jgi:hypothetical protein
MRVAMKLKRKAFSSPVLDYAQYFQNSNNKNRKSEDQKCFSIYEYMLQLMTNYYLKQSFLFKMRY